MTQAGRTTIISATHDQKMLDVSDRIVWSDDGQIDRIEQRSDVEISIGEIRSADD